MGTNNGTLVAHEAANLFPLDEENLAGLANDIRERGQLVPIETLGGKVLDGRRRWLACPRSYRSLPSSGRLAMSQG